MAKYDLEKLARVRASLPRTNVVIHRRDEELGQQAALRAFAKPVAVSTMGRKPQRGA